MPIVQPSVAKRLSFARWARTNGVSRTSSVTWSVADLKDVPADLLEGAAVDGSAPKKANSRRRKTTDKREAVAEPGAPSGEQEPEFAATDNTEEVTESDGDMSETSRG